MIKNHPTILRVLQTEEPSRPKPMPANDLKRLAMECGADDAASISLDRPELATERDFILHAFPQCKSLICFVVRMNPPAIRSTARSLANHEFHAKGHEAEDIGRILVSRLKDDGIEALNTSVGFPMEMDSFPGRTWIVSHKVVAEAAGLGKMGIHRNIIHPVFGNFILINTVLTDLEVVDESQPINYNHMNLCLKITSCM